MYSTLSCRRSARLPRRDLTQQLDAVKLQHLGQSSRRARSTGRGASAFGREAGSVSCSPPNIGFKPASLGHWIQHLEPGAIPAVKAAVAREQPIGRTQRVRADQEIARDRAALSTIRAAVFARSRAERARYSTRAHSCFYTEGAGPQESRMSCV